MRDDNQKTSKHRAVAITIERVGQIFQVIGILGMLAGFAIADQTDYGEGHVKVLTIGWVLSLIGLTLWGVAKYRST
jgi:hypothetical protein